MRKTIVALAICLTGIAGLQAVEAAKKTTQHKTAHRKPAAHRKAASQAGKKTAVAGHPKTSRPGTKRAPAKSARARTWRKGQMTPTPDRYKEIQQALVDKGYLHGEATGTWDQDSIAALRHFQQDQNLDPNGKLNSLSLIALGLGRKDETPHGKPPVPQPVQPAPPAEPASQP